MCSFKPRSIRSTPRFSLRVLLSENEAIGAIKCGQEMSRQATIEAIHSRFDEQKCSRSPLHWAAASPLQQPRKLPRLSALKVWTAKNCDCRSQKAKLRPLRNIPKLFFGPSITPKLKSLVKPMCRAIRNSRPAPNWPSTLVSLPK